MVRCGAGSNIELFQYTSPDQRNMTPKNSDIGGMHIALYVDDVQKAKDYLDSHGVKTFKGPIPIGAGPAAGETILYFVAPWGLQFESHQLSERASGTRNRRTQFCGSRQIRRSKSAPDDLSHRLAALECVSQHQCEEYHRPSSRANPRAERGGTQLHPRSRAGLLRRTAPCDDER